MSEIPDSWPPAEGADAPSGPVVPLFPLPGVFLFPRQLMPLHVFEPRYRQMVEDCLDGPGRIVMGTVREGQDESLAPPAVLEVAGLGEIVRHDKLPDGRFLIWLLGLCRVRIEEVPSERLYRKVRVEPLEESEPPEARAARLREPLEAAVRARAGDELELPADLPTGLLTDLLCQRMRVPQAVMEEIFGQPAAARRAELALAAHRRFPA